MWTLVASQAVQLPACKGNESQNQNTTKLAHLVYSESSGTPWLAILLACQRLNALAISKGGQQLVCSRIRGPHPHAPSLHKTPISLMACQGNSTDKVYDSCSRLL